MRKLISIGSTVALVISSFVFALPVAVNAAGTVVVQPADLTLVPGGWYFFDDVSNLPDTTPNPGDYEMVVGPSTPNTGVGSVQMTVSGIERFNIATYQFAGTDLDTITEMRFFTYQPSSNPGSSDRAIFMNFDVDFDNTGLSGYQGRLVFVPRDNGTVLEDTWQGWDADSGSWRWSGYVGNGNMWPDTETDELRTWADIVASFPNAEVYNESFTGQWLFRAGEPYADGFTGNVDTFVMGISADNTVYDFEPADNEAPVVTNVVSPTPVLAGSTTTVNANVDDTTTGGSDIASAEYKVGAGLWTAMAAVDATFDEVSEDVTASFSLQPGEFEICVRGTDDAGLTSDGLDCTTVFAIDPFTGFVSGGGNLKQGKKVVTTFGGNAGYVPGVGLVGNFQVVDHVAKSACHYDTINSLVIIGNTATVGASGTCNDGSVPNPTLTFVDNGEPGKNDKFQGVTLGGGNIQVHEATDSQTFTLYADGSVECTGADDTSTPAGTVSVIPTTGGIFFRYDFVGVAPSAVYGLAISFEPLCASATFYPGAVNTSPIGTGVYVGFRALSSGSHNLLFNSGTVGPLDPLHREVATENANVIVP